MGLLNEIMMTDSPKNFGIIGVAGYIAVRHLHAIKETGNNLLASLDKFDSVGRIDSYFPESDFFVEFERFDRHFDKLKRTGTKIDYVSICSPNYLHDSHIRFALRHQAEAICENLSFSIPGILMPCRRLKMRPAVKFILFFSFVFIPK
jgi:hypothetical protein